jgi:hypothetical protein
MSLPAFLAVESEPFTDAELDAYLDDQDIPEDQRIPYVSKPAAWRIDSMGEAEWAMAHYADHEQAIVDATRQAHEWQERLMEWLESERKRHVDSLTFFAGALEDFARRRREDDPKAKTLHLPSGEVKSRSVAARVVVADETVLLPWLRENAPHAIKEAVSVSELRRLATVADDRAVVEGEILPGVEVEPASVSYSISAAKP